ncbi:MAG: hypothetical protein IPP71_09215 [Bacteroidetes bacterium]|nr:hypothetical protein [Bacteroidota bacterium]
MIRRGGDWISYTIGLSAKGLTDGVNVWLGLKVDVLVPVYNRKLDCYYSAPQLPD